MALEDPESGGEAEPYDAGSSQASGLDLTLERRFCDRPRGQEHSGVPSVCANELLGGNVTFL